MKLIKLPFIPASLNEHEKCLEVSINVNLISSILEIKNTDVNGKITKGCHINVGIERYFIPLTLEEIESKLI